jgi:pimeloyl-ACP methyl ester carboxylesterase
MRIYFIPGLGVDHRLFANLDLPGHEVSYVKWIVPHRNEPLKDYALRLAEQIDTSQPFILGGVSFGGMCATEIAKVLKPQKLILVSSAKKGSELPLAIRFFRCFPLQKLIRSDCFYIKMALMLWRIFGFRGRDQYKLFKEMMESMPRGYFAPACNCVINWRNNEHEETLHIHGDNDKILPFRYICNAVRIAGGTHVMVLNNAKEIGSIIMRELERE